jgi:hypothetical protein
MEELNHMEEDPGTTEKRGGLEGELSTAIQTMAETLPPTEFVKVEKNLASLGFFTPSSKRLRNAQEKAFTITTVTDGKRIESKGTIIPSAKYGLPITADQDKWIALCKILTDIIRKEGIVTNPISFTSADILRLLHKHRHSGKNYKEVEEWLDVLFSTTIFSEGVVYLANEKRRVKDRFRVFERAVSFGKELPDGKVADKNYVWFSDWQLQNINSNHLLPIDLEAYRELKNHIAKALVPLLQIWLYATRNEGFFEKRYDELCQILNIQHYRYLSLILRTLGPSLDELKEFGYIADWQVERTSDDESYKIVLHHGEKFHRDRRARLKPRKTDDGAGERRFEIDRRDGEPSSIERRSPRADRHTAKLVPNINEGFLAELMRRGIAETHARKILADISPDQPVLTQLEWGDLQVQQSDGKITNPAGFYVSLVTGNVMPPPTFETQVQRKAREENEQRREEERRAQQELETEYDWYCESEVERYIASLDPAEVAALLEAKRRDYREKYKSLSAETNDRFAERETKFELRKRAPLHTIEEFKASRMQEPSLLKTVPEAPPDADVLAETMSDSQANDEEDSGQLPTTIQIDVPAAVEQEFVEKSPEPAIFPPASEPMIILESEPRRESGGDSIDPHLA